jgi:hypothetical protein
MRSPSSSSLQLRGKQQLPTVHSRCRPIWLVSWFSVMNAWLSCNDPMRSGSACTSLKWIPNTLASRNLDTAPMVACTCTEIVACQLHRHGALWRLALSLPQSVQQQGVPGPLRRAGLAAE